MAAAMELVIIQAILLGRLYAMYLDSKWILPALLALFISVTVICATVSGLSLQSVEG